MKPTRSSRESRIENRESRAAGLESRPASRDWRFAIRDSGRGFTLIELLVVVVIMGLGIALAATRLDFMVPKYRLRGAGREVAAAFKMAKARAVATGKDVYLEIDLPHGRYWLLVAFPKVEEGRQERLEQMKPEERIEEEARGLAYEYQPINDRFLPEGVQFVNVVFSEKESLAEGRARLRVSPFGTASHTIVNFRNAEDRQLALKFNGFTGAISFYDAYKEADELIEDSGP